MKWMVLSVPSEGSWPPPNFISSHSDRILPTRDGGGHANKYREEMCKQKVNYQTLVLQGHFYMTRMPRPISVHADFKTVTTGA